METNLENEGPRDERVSHLLAVLYDEYLAQRQEWTRIKEALTAGVASGGVRQ